MTLREKRKKFTNITDGSMMHKPLHRIREMGFNHKLFDLLDERALTKDELLSFFTLIFGEFDGIPDPQIDWKGFVNHITTAVNQERRQWNPIKKKMMPWIANGAIAKSTPRITWYMAMSSTRWSRSWLWRRSC